MSPQLERYAAMDDMAAHAERTQRFAPIRIEPPAHPPVKVLPVNLANAVVARPNLCAEFTALPTDKLLHEAEAALSRLNDAGRPTDYAVIVALMRRVASAPRLQSALWLDLPAREVA